MISAQDLKGALAILPTPAKEGADRLDATNTVDLDETARLSESLVRDGAAGIMALGTMGECATTAQNDYEAYVDCLLQTVRRRIPTFVGATALGGHEIARRIKFIKERGATGTLLGIPMWQPASRHGGEVLWRCRANLSRCSNYGLCQSARFSLRLRRGFLGPGRRQGTDRDVGQIL